MNLCSILNEFLSLFLKVSVGKNLKIICVWYFRRAVQVYYPCKGFFTWNYNRYQDIIRDMILKIFAIHITFGHFSRGHFLNKILFSWILSYILSSIMHTQRPKKIVWSHISNYLAFLQEKAIKKSRYELWFRIRRFYY